MKKTVFVCFLLFLQSFGQSSILNEYIKYGIKNNLSLQQKQFSLEQSISELKEAKGMFYPSLGINARYSRAGGGRLINIPIGDLVNPIHFGLNTLNPNFNYPTNIPNGVTRFLRQEEHETKISLIQPIIQPALFYNYSIKNNLKNIKVAEKNIYVRNLIADIQSAYFNYLKSEKIILLYEKTKLLVEENLRVTESLFSNDKITIDLLYRAKAELSEIKQKLLEAVNNSELAAAYFNYLLNKPLNSPVIIDSFDIPEMSDKSLADLEEIAVNNREELTQLRLAIETADDSRDLAASNYYPGIALAVDYGFQGEKYKFTKDDDFWMASLVLNWNIFNGFQDEAKTEKAEIESKNLLAKSEEIKQMIRLQTKESYNNYIVAYKTIESARERLNSYNKSFKIIEKKFGEGLASQLEYLDAQNNYTQAEISHIISEYNLLESYILLEKTTAMADLNYYNLGENK
jgi:outer membrane protein TolC